MLTFTTGLSPTLAFGLLVAISAILAWAITEVFRQVLRERSLARVPSWVWDGVLRCVSLSVGAGIGLLLEGSLLGAAVGASAGALNSIIVWAVKRRIKALASTSQGQGGPDARVD